jgi:hypothetical protein
LPLQAERAIDEGFPARLAGALDLHVHVAAIERSGRLDATGLYRRSVEIGHALLQRGVMKGKVVGLPQRLSLECLVVELGIRIAGAIPRFDTDDGAGPAFVGARGALALVEDGAAAVPLDLLAARGIAWAASNPEALAVAPRREATPLPRVSERVLVLSSSAPARQARDEALLAGATLCFPEPHADGGIEVAAIRFAASSALATVDQVVALGGEIVRRTGPAAGWRALVRRHPAAARRVARGGLPRAFRTIAVDGEPDAGTIAALGAAGIALSLQAATA